MRIKVPQSSRSRKVKTPKAKDLLAWYDRHRRVLPWRALPGEKPDPYRVWLSEIMLQQTTVAAVGPYFETFLRQWPTVRALAAASLDDVRKLWAGLGYYRRAASLHEAAKVVVRDFNGVFPETEEELQKLPGIGPYTSAAMAAIAFDRKANVVDGNVERVVARLFAIKDPMPASKPALRAQAATLLPASRFGDYAQAMMDLGATVCTPRSPRCGLCPFSGACLAEAEGIAEELPARLAPKAKPLRRTLAFVGLHPKKGVLLRQRPPSGLLGGMMEVPSSPWGEGAKPKLQDVLGFAPDEKADWALVPGLVRHVFTHFELDVQVAVASVRASCQGKWVPLAAVVDEALPSVMLKIIRHAIKKKGEG